MSDPSKLQEEYTRYQLYLQLRSDIFEEKLYLPPPTAILLASYTVQCKYLERNQIFNNYFIYSLAELGDYNPEEHEAGYLSHLQLVPNQNEEIESKISELHKLHKYVIN